MKRTTFVIEEEVYLFNNKVYSVEDNMEVPCLAEIVLSQDNVFFVVLEVDCRQEARPARREGYADTHRPDESIDDRSLLKAFVEERSLETTIHHPLTEDQQAELFSLFEDRIYQAEV